VTIRVLIADDQAMVRAGFRMLLSGEQDIEVVAEARDGREAVAKAAQSYPTVILMDIRMPEFDGLEATRRIITADHDARILILTTFGLDEYVYEALRAGASGFVLKDDPPEQLIAAVRTVAGGDALLSPAITKRVIKQFTRSVAPRRRRNWTSSRHASKTSSGLSPMACPTQRSGNGSTSARRPSRHTSRTSCRSSASVTASRRSYSHTRPGSSRNAPRACRHPADLLG
jgi:DNA-binding NarL/FixJ family response regulator